MTKLYVVNYHYNGNVDTAPNLDHLKNAEYVGTSYERALSVAKSYAKWSGDCAVYSFDVDNMQNLSHSGTISENKRLVKLAMEIESYITDLISARSHLVKNGKITITLDKESIPTREGRSVDRYGRKTSKIWTKYDVEIDERMSVVKMVTDKYIKDKGITVPIKINYDGKTYCKYNQK